MRRLIVVDSTHSTNGWLKEHLACPLFTAVRARCQTAGRGRRGNNWFSGSAEENLTFSQLLPCSEQPQLLYARVALCARRILARWTECRIKWPNDIVVGEKKLAGILCEFVSPTSAVVGIGINVGTKEFPPQLAGKAVSFAMLTVEPPSVQKLWLCLVRELWREFRRKTEPQAVVAEFQRHAVRYQKHRDFPGQYLEFQTILPDGRALFLHEGKPVLLAVSG
ncbi:MAG: biotin--[acetyl-CoA-carboxylase] ligase [Turneriella sp.]|nr:biotin--[acetyl-CoA-carboxylase] ligase [Turneriella sp.]